MNRLRQLLMSNWAMLRRSWLGWGSSRPSERLVNKPNSLSVIKFTGGRWRREEKLTKEWSTSYAIGHSLDWPCSASVEYDSVCNSFTFTYLALRRHTMNLLATDLVCVGRDLLSKQSGNLQISPSRLTRCINGVVASLETNPIRKWARRGFHAITKRVWI